MDSVSNFIIHLISRYGRRAVRLANRLVLSHNRCPVSRLFIYAVFILHRVLSDLSCGIRRSWPMLDGCTRIVVTLHRIAAANHAQGLVLRCIVNLIDVL
jgi:hypothetical protein